MSPVEDLKVSNEPFDRLTLLAQAMSEGLELMIADERRDIVLSGVTDPEKVQDQAPDVRGMIFLSDAHHSGIQMFGYEHTSEAMAELLVHMKAMFQSAGKSFGVMTDSGVMLLEED